MVNTNKQSYELLTEFIKALDEEIKAIKAGKSSPTVRVNDGQFVRKSSRIFVYSFILENFVTVVDGAEADRVFIYDGKVMAILEAKQPGKDLWSALEQVKGYTKAMTI